MFTNAMLPPEFMAQVSGEDADFGVQATRRAAASNKGKDMMMVIFFILLPLFVIAISLLRFELPGSIINMIFVSIFLAVGIFYLKNQSSLFKAKDLYFIGTKTKVLSWDNGKLKEKKWQDFNGKIKVDEKNGFGDITFELKTGSINKVEQGQNRYTEVYVPDVFHISGIQNVRDVADMCIKRIEENKQI